MASGSRTKTASTYLECTECGNTTQIHRKKSRLKEKDHIKHMYCFKCINTTAHREVKEDAFVPKWLKEWHTQQEGTDTND